MRTKEQATSFLFLRHGATDFPENRYYCDTVEDPALNTVGIKQAAGWPDRLKGKSINALYASPSRRTQETARPTAKQLNLKIETLEGLRERTFGSWDGLTNEIIQQRFPAEWSAWKKDPLHFTPSGGESLAGFAKRVDETIQTLLTRHAGQTVLLVTHVGPIRMIVSAALGVAIENHKRLVVGSCSLTQIDYTASWPNLVFFSLRPESFS
ncbi:MAG: histidine phosphatase family protein [Candidatus Manganitrophaceae bacterium]|nr:MAG: histidine phosphatase family protein [Candidatus Manganitrophaceae bacterium]